MSQLLNVFVYGSLKRGEPNHLWFSKLATAHYKFIGECKTVEKYPLIIATRYNVPFLLDAPGRGKRVKGELYEVDEAMLNHLDVLEDHPNFYIREQREIQHLDGSKTEKAWMYFIKKFRDEMLDKTTFENYSSSGEHGLKFVGRSERESNTDYRSEILKM